MALHIRKRRGGALLLLTSMLLALTAGVVINRVYERLTPSEKHGGCAADGEGLLP